MSIGKNYLLPRSGLPGLLDRIAGPKATTMVLK